MSWVDSCVLGGARESGNSERLSKEIDGTGASMYPICTLSWHVGPLLRR